MNEKQQRNDQRKPLVEPLDKLIPLSEKNNELISIFVASHRNLAGNPKKAIIPSFPFCPSSLLARYSIFNLVAADRPRWKLRGLCARREKSLDVQ